MKSSYLVTRPGAFPLCLLGEDMRHLTARMKAVFSLVRRESLSSSLTNIQLVTTAVALLMMMRTTTYHSLLTLGNKHRRELNHNNLSLLGPPAGAGTGFGTALPSTSTTKTDNPTHKRKQFIQRRSTNILTSEQAAAAEVVAVVIYER